jgi:hypothetical protein
MIRLRNQYPKAGAREIVSLLFHEENMSVYRCVFLSLSLGKQSHCVGYIRALVVEYFALYEPEMVRERRKNRLRRKRFWAAGVNDIWAVDQHDKWKHKFGLALHSCTDPFVGVMHWMKIWWTNSNPRLILSYHLDRVEEVGGTKFDSFCIVCIGSYTVLYSQLRHLCLRVILGQKTTDLRMVIFTAAFA